MNKKIIVAADKNGCIGKDGGIPWHFSEDFKWFKKTTLHHSLVMGRKTFESIGKPLSGRLNVVLTKSDPSDILKPYLDKIRIASSLHEAFSICGANVMSKCFVCGGAQVYKEALPLVDEIILTKIPGEYDGDTYFPIWPLEKHGWVANIKIKQLGDLAFWSYVKADRA